ncbi:MAG TPA: TRAP transporter small permease [Xanthobacteraceae bacterium]|jgi:TRAP-type C4-dicarboxylate transport system permease small subunit
MTGLLDRLNGRASVWLARIAAFILSLLAVATFADVVARYFFNRPFTFTVEMTELAMGLIVYLGVGLVTHNNSHITVDVVTLRLEERTRALFSLLTNLLAFAFLAVMIWQLFLRAQFLLAKADTTPIWRIPYWPIAFVMASASVLLLTGVLLHLIGAFQQLAGKQKRP